MSESEQEVREALYEFQQYLSDQLAPLLVKDSIALLLSKPPSLAASAIRAWIQAQPHRSDASRADYSYHALRKLHVFAELGLITGRTLAGYLAALGEMLIDDCPPEDRERLRESVAGLGEETAGLVSSVEVLHRQPGSEGDRDVPAPRAVEPSYPRRLTLLLERLDRLLGPAAGASPASAEGPGDLLAQVVATAAKESVTGQELDGHLDRLKQLGAATGTDQVFHALADGLPGWAVTRPETGIEPAAATTTSEAAEAMERMITLAEAPAEAAKRFREMTEAAIAQFNEGLLTRSAIMFELAERVAAEGTVNSLAVSSVRESAHEHLDAKRLRKFAESPDKHPLLRKVLGFFSSLSPDGLLDELEAEQERDRHHLLLDLLEAHGEPARSTSLERLEAALTGDDRADPAFLRSLIYVLRKVPRGDATGVETEIELISRAAGPHAPLSLAKEGIACLGGFVNDKSEAALIGYLKTFEGILLRDETGEYDREHFDVLLDRTVSALARMGTRRALRLVADHGLKTQDALGDTAARLDGLGAHDLSSSPELVSRLVAALQAALPRGLLGRFRKPKEGSVVHLVKALSGTPTDAVKTALAEVSGGFPDTDYGRAAAKALEGFDVAVAPRRPSLSGDLDLFGLPSLLQNLAGAPATGTLSLLDAAENVASVLTWQEGKLLDCRTGQLEKKEAVYQLFERPFPGTFSFVSSSPAESASGDHEPLDIMFLIMEGIRRYDEFQKARAVVPDEAVLKTTEVQATLVEDEPDGALAESVWERVVSGRTPAECESDAAVDAFRVRRLLAHWVEEGALEQA